MNPFVSYHQPHTSFSCSPSSELRGGDRWEAEACGGNKDRSRGILKLLLAQLVFSLLHSSQSLGLLTHPLCTTRGIAQLVSRLKKWANTCMCYWVTLLCSRKLTEHCKSAIMEKIKIIIKKCTKRERQCSQSLVRGSGSCLDILISSNASHLEISSWNLINVVPR